MRGLSPSPALREPCQGTAGLWRSLGEAPRPGPAMLARRSAPSPDPVSHHGRVAVPPRGT